MARNKKEADPNAATRDAILRAMMAGLPFGKACHVAGTSRRTGYRMRERDATFNAAVIASRSVLELHCLDTIRKASTRHWTAAAWLNQRRFDDPVQKGPKGERKPQPFRNEHIAGLSGI